MKSSDVDMIIANMFIVGSFLAKNNKTKKIKKIKNENKTLLDLVGWLDEKGFNTYFEALNFIEDSLGQAELQEVKTCGMETINKFGTYLLLDDDKNMCLMHLHGRAFLTDEQRASKIEQNKQNDD